MTTILSKLLASSEFSLTLEPFAGSLEPSVWVQLPAKATIDDLDEVLDYLGSELDLIKLDEPSWIVETSKRGERRGVAALVVPNADVPRATYMLLRDLGHWRKEGDVARAVEQLRRFLRRPATSTLRR